MGTIYSINKKNVCTIYSRTLHFCIVKHCSENFAILLNYVHNYIVSSIKPNVP